MTNVVSYVGSRVENLKGVGSGESESVLPYFSIDQVRSFRPMFGFLNDKDRDILFLIFVSRKKQKDVQRILGRSQPSLCYDIKRIRYRLKFIFYLHEVFDIFVNFVNQGDIFSEEEMGVLTLMFYTSSFTLTSRILDISQVKTRYAYNKCLWKMHEMGMYDVYEIFNNIRYNLNMVRRVYRGETEQKRLPLVV